jgi:transketolase
MSINSKLKLNKGITDVSQMEQKPIRDGYGTGLVKAGEENQNVVVLCADLTESTRSLAFREKFPARFLEIGISEQNMASVASGMAAMGKVPFISSYAMFSPGRNWEQIRTTICYNDQNVKIGGAHAGVSVGPDGATHQAIEDIAIMRVLPNMTVIVPCDAHEAERATLAAARHQGPVYVRFARDKTPVVTTPETPFELGKASIFWGNDAPQVAIIATGAMVYNSIVAAAELEKQGVKAIVLNMHTIKPIDEEAIISAAKSSGAVVTAEEHQMIGGLGSAVAEVLVKNYPVPMEFVGVRDRFGESGNPSELMEYFGLAPRHIAEAVQRVIARKQ